jgi:polar amino acid transport system substrate-binding protein
MLLALCLYLSVAAAQPLRSIAQSGAPVKYAAPGEARAGLCREAAQALTQFDPRLQIAGLEREASLRRIERMLEQDEIDVFLCLLDTPERRARFDFLSVPIYRVRHVLVQRREDERRIESYQQLAQHSRGLPVLVAQGSALARQLDRQGVRYSDAPGNDIVALRMLLAGRGDAVYGQDMTLAPLLRLPEFEGRLRLGEVALAEERHYLALSRRLPGATRQHLETALATLERQGTLRELAERYRRP